MNITYQDALNERNLLLFCFVRDHGRLPLGFPTITSDAFGVVALHRWMMRTYLQITVNYESLSEFDVELSETRVLDNFKNLQMPDFEELLAITLAVYLADSHGPTRAIYRLRQHVDAQTYFNKCNICMMLKIRTSFQ